MPSPDPPFRSPINSSPTDGRWEWGRRENCSQTPLIAFVDFSLLCGTDALAFSKFAFAVCTHFVSWKQKPRCVIYYLNQKQQHTTEEGGGDFPEFLVAAADGFAFLVYRDGNDLSTI